MIRFFEPQVFFLLIPWTLLILLWMAWERGARRKLEGFAAADILARLLRGYSPARRRLRIWLALGAAFLAIVALARPQAGSREEFVPSQGLDLVFLLDVSNSMLTEDVVPSRLKKAKHVIRNFVDRMSGDRVGIVAFAASAYPAVPLTSDYEYVKQALEVLDTKSIANQGSDLAKAVVVGAELLDRGGVNSSDESGGGDAEGASRVMIVLSDGESHVGGEVKLIPRLKKEGIRVYSIGAGSAKGGPIPIRDDGGNLQGYKKDSGGGMVLSKLESGNLESLATKTGGKFYSASTNEGEVPEILSELSTMDRSEGAGRRVLAYEELFQVPLLVGAFLVTLMLLLRETSGAGGSSTAPGVFAGILMTLAAFHPREGIAASSWREYRDTREGIAAYEEKDYAGAVQEFGKAQAANPDSAIHHLNLGDALLKSGAGAAAVPEFEKILRSKDNNEAARGAYNLGKAHESQEKHEDSLRAYQQGLDRLFADPDADSETVLRLKRALEQSQQSKSKQASKQGKEGEQGEGKPDPKQSEDDEKKDQNQRPVRNPKPQFKEEKLSEADARRVMQQLQEQEKRAQQRVMRVRTGKAQDAKNPKDW